MGHCTQAESTGMGELIINFLGPPVNQFLERKVCWSRPHTVPRFTTILGLGPHWHLSHFLSSRAFEQRICRDGASSLVYLPDDILIDVADSIEALIFILRRRPVRPEPSCQFMLDQCLLKIWRTLMRSLKPVSGVSLGKVLIWSGWPWLLIGTNVRYPHTYP